MKFTFLNVLIFTALLLTPLVNQADSFRWVDEYGKVHIGVKPAPEPVEMDEGDEEEEAIEEASVTPAQAPPKVTKKQKPLANQHESRPQTVAPVVAAPKITPPVKAPAPTKASKPAQKPSVKKPVIVKKAAPAKKPPAKKVPAKKPAVKKTVAKKKPVAKPKKSAEPKKVAKPKGVAKPKKAAAVKPKAASAKAASKRDEDMCGVFTGYVQDYEDKVSNCSKNLCGIYQRSLDRYKKKQKSYCGG
jgi:hypothetical protein